MSRQNGPTVPAGPAPSRPARLQQPVQPPVPPSLSISPTDQLSQHSFRLSQARAPATQGHPSLAPHGYAPQHDPYAAAQLDPYAAQQPFAQPQQHYANPQAYEAPVSQPPLPPGYAPNLPPVYAQPTVPAPRQPLPAYDQWMAPAAPQDPRGYDLGGYGAPAPASAPVHSETYLPPQQPAYHPEAQGYQGAPAASDWSQLQHATHGGVEPSLDPAPYAADPQHGHTDPSQHFNAEPADHVDEYADGEEGYEEEPPRGRFLKIAAALVGAIVVGGGLALAYTQLIAPDAGKTPVIKNAAGPSKQKSADPGGKKFAGTNSKLMERLSDGSAPAEGDASGVKKVPTVQVNADGTIAPPAETPAEPVADAAPPAAPAPAASPGSDFEFPGGPGATLADSSAPPSAAAPAADAPVKVTPPKAPDKQVAAAPLKPAVSNTQTNSIQAPAAKPAAPVVKKVAAAVPAAADPTAAPVAQKAPAAVATAITGAGYVAVLASVPVSSTSRINALKQFADMQQKYATLLQDKKPDVMEANVADKGAYHRLVVGPPGSRQRAQELCGSLKAAGYAQSCWVTAY